ncbi:MAG: branched-chain amino acid transport [Erysipelotrichaceae bacterium]|nr:MAG: branched-chain amino acid [Erysipelotrichaceae bacterium]TXT17769.1 MAG: branched-chain amino acid transport [Erysipelotrichaceae bacterium]
MSDLQLLIMVLAMALATILTRFLPFILFPQHKPIPKVVSFLADRLPYASLGMLVVYALKDVKIATAPYGLTELFSLIVIALIHQWKSNTLLSISGGLLVYLFLVNYG